jgi:tRNA(adenine34) deaminase
MIFNDEYFMKAAIREAQQAFDKDEVPIGAVVVCQNQIIGRAHNLTETLNDVTAHAEMQVITSAADYIGGKYLSGCTLYVTVEPCPMCAGALYWAQIDKIVYGIKDEKRGFSSVSEKLLHPKTKVVSGVCDAEILKLMQSFFLTKRK